MNTCLRVLKETKWILSFYYNSLSISQTTFRHCRRTLFWTTFVETAVSGNNMDILTYSAIGKSCKRTIYFLIFPERNILLIYYFHSFIPYFIFYLNKIIFYYFLIHTTNVKKINNNNNKMCVEYECHSKTIIRTTTTTKGGENDPEMP